MKKLNIVCNFADGAKDFTIYIGQPDPKHHPLEHQNNWLRKERGGEIPSKIMENFAKLKEIADKNNVSFEKLCEYAFQAALSNDDQKNKEVNA